MQEEAEGERERLAGRKDGAGEGGREDESRKGAHLLSCFLLVKRSIYQ
jgi:hypothetical protein